MAGANKLTVRNDAEERYISYVFLCQSGTQHANLKEYLQNGFTAGGNRYPKTRQETLHLLDKYSKVATPKMIVSEGMSFAQLDNNAPYDKKYWKDKDCYNFGKKGHPANHCKKPNKDRKRDSDNDDRYVESTADSIQNLEKYVKPMKIISLRLTHNKHSSRKRQMDPICQILQNMRKTLIFSCILRRLNRTLNRESLQY